MELLSLRTVPLQFQQMQEQTTGLVVLSVARTVQVHAIIRSYSIGSVTGGGTNVGGLLGRNNTGSVTVSFWNTETSGQTSSPGGGTGKTTTQLQTPTDYWEYDELNDDYINTIYLSWDDDDIDGDGEADAPWNFGTDSQYPVLIFGGHQADVQRGPDFTVGS